MRGLAHGCLWGALLVAGYLEGVGAAGAVAVDEELVDPRRKVGLDLRAPIPRRIGRMSS